MKKSSFVGTWKTFKQNVLNFNLELNFNNFQERNMVKFQVGCYNILTVGIDNIEFYINLIVFFLSFYTPFYFIIF